MPRQAWSYIIRRAYFDRINIAGLTDEKSKASFEPYHFVPLILSGGKAAFINKPLYQHIYYEESHSKSSDINKKIAFYDNYIKAIDDTLKKVVNPHEFDYYSRSFKFFFTESLIKMLKNIPTEEAGVIATERELVLRSLLRIDSRLRKGRIIGYGVLGKRADIYIPILKKIHIDFDELWDKNADVNGVITPDIKSLIAEDNVIIFPKDYDEIVRSLEPSGCNILYADKIYGLENLL
jgi:hypothetical protein